MTIPAMTPSAEERVRHLLNALARVAGVPLSKDTADAIEAAYRDGYMAAVAALRDVLRAAADKLTEFPSMIVMLDDLIARLEAATEGNRELDEAIATVIWGAPISIGKFTTSIDAAATLVPPVFPNTDRRQWSLVSCGDVPAQAGLYTEGQWWHGEAATSALALCIAALRARAAQGRTP